MNCKVLATRASVDRHTGVNLAAEINDTMVEFGLERRVFACIHDNAANISLAGNMIDGTQPDRPKAFNIGCAAHSLNLCIGDAMKKGVDKPFETMVAAARRLVGHFKMSSLATNGLRAKVKEILPSEHRAKGLIQDVSTRWNSTFYMLERLSLLRWPVVAVLSDQSLTKPQEARVLDMSAESWKLAEEIVPVLRKVELATVLFSSPSRTTSGVILPAISGLVKQLNAMTFERVNVGQRRVAAPPGQNFRDTLVQSLTDRFFLDELNLSGEETITCKAVPFYLLASFMDPRFRDLSFLSEVERKSLLEFASQTVKDMPSTSSPTSSDAAATTAPEIAPPAKKKSRSELAMEELLGKGNSSDESTGEVISREEKIDKEINQLSDEAPIPLTEDALVWWKENEKRYPLLRNLAARVLAAPPTSVPSEQIFSKAGLVVSKKRAALKPAIVDALLFLNKNTM